MDEDTLMGQVQASARLGSRADAERAVRAALETLAEKIPAGLSGHLAAQLPHEVGEDLRRIAEAPSHKFGEGFGRAEFLRRVAERAGVREEQAATLAGVVLGVIGEASTGGILDRVFRALPHDLRRLLEPPAAGEPPAP